MSTADTVQATVAALALPFAGAAWLAAHRSANQARRSARSAEVLSEIETRREHRDMFPQVDISTARDQGATQFRLVIRLNGPDVLDHLDSFVVSIRDDGDPHPPNPETGITQEDIDQQIWGPYRLSIASTATDQWGRASTPVPLSVGDEWSCAIETTDPPRWANSVAWQQQYSRAPIRLELRCVREGFKPWTLRREIQKPSTSPPLTYA